MLPERKWVIDANSLDAPYSSRKAFRRLLDGELFHDRGPDFLSSVGKKAAGRLLDGVEHNGMPEVRI